MTEQEARQVLLLQSRESGMPSPSWSADDRAWATRQAVATVGDEATPERFVIARAVVALQRLLPRDTAAQRWLARRGWHAAWVLLALVLGFAAGVVVDQLGPPQRVNLLAPHVWVVVAWNLLVYLMLLLPWPGFGLRALLARWGLGDDVGVSALWAQQAGPLLAQRVALVLHTAAAALGLGLVAGLYLRGLVLDYRAGWQSTFLTTEQVQQLLQYLLAPARWLTGIPPPDVAALRVGPGGDATASAAPWIHLYAATLALFVLLPRGLLAWAAGASARRQALRFPLPLNTPYFESLHPLMRPELSRTVRLLWLSSVRPVSLFGLEVGTAEQTLEVLRSDEGDALAFVPLPPGVGGTALEPARPRPWWALWSAAPADPLPRLREQIDAVLLVTTPGEPRPDWLAALGRPLIVLVDSLAPEPPQLPLRALADGWLADGRLLQALHQALPGDPRLPRLAAAWTARQRARVDAAVAELADTLARIACAREAVADEGADGARQALVAALDSELRSHGARLAALIGVTATPDDDAQAVPAAAAALRSRLGEGRAALFGGVVTGALAGLKADVLSGGLTMGAGAVAGGLIGALGAAGAARGLNVVRGTDRSFVAWNEEALAPITAALLLRYAVLAHGLAPDAARERVDTALAAQQATLASLWRARQRRYDNAGEAIALAPSLRRPLTEALAAALGGPRMAP
jgi:hypothetical protein